MSDYRNGCLPDHLIYLIATEISRYRQTRFNINTHLLEPNDQRLIKTQLPIESILLYSYKTPLSDDHPKKLFSHYLKGINFSDFASSHESEDTKNKENDARRDFLFDYYSSKLEKNLKIVLPKLVLARDLFFSHPYLLRAALFAENYSTDLVVDMDDPAAIHIFIAKNKKILKQDIADPHFLKKLALILLHPDLNQAFLSIYKRTIEDQKNFKSFRFDMDAPTINNIDLAVNGIYNRHTGIYKIERITSFTNLETHINRPIHFHFSPKKLIQLAKKFQAQSSRKSEKPTQDKSQLHPDTDADIDKVLTKLRNIAGQIYTVEELNIVLDTPSGDIQAYRRRKQLAKESDQEERFAAGEGDIDGTLPGFTNESEVQLERASHQDLLKVLKKIEQNGYDIQEIRNSPFDKYERFRGHKLANHQSRYFYIYKISHTQTDEQFYLCEIDTSDSKKNISTLLLKCDEKTQLLIENNLKNFNNAILARSLSWPKTFLSDVLGITTFTTINHPSKKEQVEQVNYYTDWAKRIIEKLKSI